MPPFVPEEYIPFAYLIVLFLCSKWRDIKPLGTLRFKFVIKRGVVLVNTVPSSDAQVSPAEQAMEPINPHYQEKSDLLKIDNSYTYDSQRDPRTTIVALEVYWIFPRTCFQVVNCSKICCNSSITYYLKPVSLPSCTIDKLT